MATASEEARIREEQTVQAVLSTREGRHFVRMVLDFCMWNEDLYTSEPTLLAARVGRHSAGVSIYRKLEELQPDLLAKVFIEERERNELFKRRSEDGGRDE